MVKFPPNSFVIASDVSFLELPDMPGVWTEEEDNILKRGDARSMAKLDEKHGIGASATRLMLLRTWRSASAEIQSARRSE